jgi:hypothetical protein
MTEKAAERRCMTWQRMAHNPEVAGSNPAPATGKAPETGLFCFLGGDLLWKLLPTFAQRSAEAIHSAEKTVLVAAVLGPRAAELGSKEGP